MRTIMQGTWWVCLLQCSLLRGIKMKVMFNTHGIKVVDLLYASQLHFNRFDVYEVISITGDNYEIISKAPVKEYDGIHMKLSASLFKIIEL